MADVMGYKRNEFLSQCQNDALEYIENTHKFEKDDSIDNSLVTYIKAKCPININYDYESLKKMIQDTNYRNQFETGTSSGYLNYEKRTYWENQMFNNIYDKAPAFDRVKYGSLNLNPLELGDTTGSAYGSSYFILKDDIKSRTTLCVGDSGSNIDSQIKSIVYNFNSVGIMFKSEHRYADLIDYTTLCHQKFNINSNHSRYRTYIEAHIHGPVTFKSDIDSVVINIKYITNNKIDEYKNIVYEFANKNNCQYQFVAKV
jgi:hypothetical protein